MRIPFPRDHESFKGDHKTQKLLSQIESYVEIGHDLDDVLGLLGAVRKLAEDVQMSLRLCGLFGLVPGTLAQSALLLYARCFNESKGRTRLDAKQIFIDENHEAMHKKYMGIRDQFIAHQGANANRHYVHVVRTDNGPRLDPNGESSRLLFHEAIDLSEFIDIVIRTKNYVTSRIDEMCESVRTRLNEDQISAINSLNTQDFIRTHSETTRVRSKDPFGSRVSEP